MEYVRLGETGTRVSELCFGTWRFGKEGDAGVETDRETAHDLLDAYVEAGGNFVDTADEYGDPQGTAERYVGDWLADRDRDRDDLVIASKVYFPFDERDPNARGLSRKHVRDQIDGTLDRLGTDYLDVYYMHNWDESVPLRETLSTLSWLVESGRVNHVGASNFAAWQLTKALWKADVDGWCPVDVVQPKFNAVHREPVADVLDVCADQGLGVCSYSPLAGGFLTGKYERADDGGYEGPDGARGTDDAGFEIVDVSPAAWDVLDAVRAVADEVDATPAQVSLRWAMDHDAVTAPIVGARTGDQLRENLAAVDLSLTDDQYDRIAAASAAERRE